jgi:ribonuclease Y
MEIINLAIVAVVCLAVGGTVGYLVRRYSGANKLAEAETQAKEIVLEAKEKSASLLVELKNEEKDRRKEIDALEARVLHREETLDKKLTDLSAEEGKLRAREDKAKLKEDEVAKKEGDIDARLEKIGGLSVVQAKEEILRRALFHLFAVLAVYFLNG